MLVSVVSEVKEKVGREEKRKGGKMGGKKRYMGMKGKTGSSYNY